MNTQLLEKSSMGFKLTNGKTLLITEEDVKKLVDQFWVQMIMDKRTHVYMLEDPGLQRSRELYKVYEAEKKEMDDSMKKDYLRSILKYLSDKNFELTTLEKLIKKDEKNKPLAPIK